MRFVKSIIFLCLPILGHGYVQKSLLNNAFSAYIPGSYMGFSKDKHANSLLNDILYYQPLDLNIYGWLNPTYNLSNAQNSNTPSGFPFIPNQIEMNQASIVLQKHVDTIQSDHIELGFKIMNWWGTDYRYSTMQGIFSQQFFQENLLYGYDMPEAYMELFLPGIGEGTLLTLGRHQSRGDIESLNAPENFLINHSIMFIASSFTQFGLTANTLLNENWSYNIGIHSGSDIAPWGASATPSLMGFLKWVSTDRMNSIHFGINSINNGQYTNNHDNLQQLNGIYTHAFNEYLYLESEAYYEYQFNARLGGNLMSGPIESYGGGMTAQPIIPGYSGSVGFLTYLVYGVRQNDLLTFRADYFNDFQGQRTGYATQYLGASVGWSHLIADVWRIRSELLFLSTTGAPAFDNGNRNQLLMGLVDFVVMI